jgi:hypothetical protein
VCLLRGSCIALCLLSRCRLCLALLGVVPFRSAPLGVLRPKPRWGRAWSPIWGFFFSGFSRLNFVSYIDKGAEKVQMHEHHGNETNQRTKNLTSINVSRRNQQPRNTDKLISLILLFFWHQIAPNIAFQCFKKCCSHPRLPP